MHIIKTNKNKLNLSKLNTCLNYTLRQATLEDAFEIWSVMDTCSKTMVQKEHFICDDLNYVKDILSGHGFGVVACDLDGNIVGNLLVKYPRLNEENLGYDVFTTFSKNTFQNISINSNHHPILTQTDSYKKQSDCNIALTCENLNRVVHMDSASVHPNHRGHSLERQMIAFAETLLDTSKYQYSFATVAPENTASLKSLERNGYQVMVIKQKYGGLMRCVMMKELMK